MRHDLLIIAIVAAGTVLSCKKANEPKADCFPGCSTVRLISNKNAVIKVVGSQYYIIEEGAVDTKLNPCNLSQEFLINDLHVTISGEVKSTVSIGTCCTENFVLTGISL
ncbi:MAG: hypothetical protein ABI741_16555 [Ferruginibacter sp.]